MPMAMFGASLVLPVPLQSGVVPKSAFPYHMTLSMLKSPLVGQVHGVAGGDVPLESELTESSPDEPAQSEKGSTSFPVGLLNWAMATVLVASPVPKIPLNRRGNVTRGTCTRTLVNDVSNEIQLGNPAGVV